jgi:hypothetical protein
MDFSAARQKPLGRNQEPAIGGVKLRELRIQPCKRGVGDLADHAQWMRPRKPLLNIDIAE